MISLRPNFRQLKQIVRAGSLAAVAAIFLSLPSPALFAGGIPNIPAWYRVEMDAISLYQSGINQESSDPAGAVKALRQARQDSTAAITEGGGNNPAVLHNDALIGKALMTAEALAAGVLENNPAAEQQKNNGNNQAKRNGNHLQATIKPRKLS